MLISIIYLFLFLFVLFYLANECLGYQPLEPLPAQHMNWFLRSITEWFQYFIDIFGVEVVTPVSYPLELDENSNHVTYLIDSAVARTIELPELDTENFRVTIKDVVGKLDLFPATLERFNAGDTIEGLQEDYALEAPFGSWTLVGDAATNSWRIV